MNQVRQGFPKRFLAGLIDGVIMFVLSMVITVLFRSAPRLLMIISPAVMLCYVALEVIKAQSVGKMVMKLKITNPDGSDASRDTLMKRFAVKYAGTLIALVGGIVGLTIINMLGMLVSLAVLVGFFLMFRPDKLALHDILAKTAVFGPETAGVGFPVTVPVGASNPQPQ